MITAAEYSLFDDLRVYFGENYLSEISPDEQWLPDRVAAMLRFAAANGPQTSNAVSCVAWRLVKWPEEDEKGMIEFLGTFAARGNEQGLAYIVQQLVTSHDAGDISGFNWSSKVRDWFATSGVMALQRLRLPSEAVAAMNLYTDLYRKLAA